MGSPGANLASNSAVGRKTASPPASSRRIPGRQSTIVETPDTELTAALSAAPLQGTSRPGWSIASANHEPRIAGRRSCSHRSLRGRSRRRPLLWPKQEEPKRTGPIRDDGLERHIHQQLFDTLLSTTADSIERSRSPSSFRSLLVRFPACTPARWAWCSPSERIRCLCGGSRRPCFLPPPSVFQRSTWRF